jgi:protein SCO1/2
MALLQKSFKKDAKRETSLENAVQLVSLTVQPEHDTFQVLRQYADRFNANPDHWWLMTGDKKMIYNFARKDLGLATGPGDGGAEDFIHSDKLVLLDKDRNIRGYYNGLNDSEVRKCADDIVLLTIERKKKKK